MKKIFISGVSRGIGLAIAKRFSEAGYHIVGCARGQEGLEEAAAHLPDFSPYICDVADKDKLKAMIQQVNAEHGRFDVLVNNAGHFVPGAMHDEEDAVMEGQMATNFFSTYYLSKGFLPEMVDAGTGTIINICSIASITAYDAGGAYSVSKHAQYGFHKSLREEMKPKGIRVIAILPGAVYTSSWDGAGVPAERMMPAEDIAEITFSAVQLSARTVVEDIVLRPQLGDL